MSIFKSFWTWWLSNFDDADEQSQPSSSEDDDRAMFDMFDRYLRYTIVRHDPTFMASLTGASYSEMFDKIDARYKVKAPRDLRTVQANPQMYMYVQAVMIAIEGYREELRHCGIEASRC